MTTVKELCAAKGNQNCIECDDYSCGDNLNPVMASMSEHPVNVTCHICERLSTAFSRHVFYKESGKITCCNCLVDEDKRKQKEANDGKG